HQRDAGPGGGRHGACTCPSCAQNHADSSEFVLRLDDGKSSFAVSANSISLHVIDEGFYERGRRRDGIPRDYGYARKHGSHSSSRVAVDDDHARRLIHALDGEGVALGERCGGVVITRLGGVPVQVGGLDLLGELFAKCFFDFSHIEVQQLRHHPDVDHVLDQLAQLGFGADSRTKLVERGRVEHQVRAKFVELQRLVVENRGTRLQRHHVFARGLRVHRNDEVNLFFAGNVTPLAGANGVPGRQSGDVRGKQVFAGDGNAHLEDG